MVRALMTRNGSKRPSDVRKRIRLRDGPGNRVNAGGKTVRC